jgi:hypothetical protein
MTTYHPRHGNRELVILKKKERSGNLIENKELALRALREAEMLQKTKVLTR